MIKLKELVFFIFTTLSIGFIGSFLGDTSKYNNLIKPDFAPPSYLFSLIWTILYFLMGISIYIIYMSKDTLKRKRAINIYILQLVVNATWNFIFFGLELRLLAFLWILLLIVLVLIMINRFYTINKLAANLQIPYLIWLMFALVLNYSIYMLNK